MIVCESLSEHFTGWWIGRQGMTMYPPPQSLLLPMEIDKSCIKSENQH